MIRQLFVVILLACSCSKEQKNSDWVNKSKDSLAVLFPDKLASKHKGSDTIFISREITKDYYHTIYIDTKRQSEYYKWLTDFTFDEDDKSSYDGTYKYAKSKNPDSYKRTNFTDLPQQWIPVYPYKNKYYLYAPSDWGNAGKRMINDSSFVFWYMDGPSPAPLQSIKQQGNNIYVLEIASIYDKSSPPEKVTIYKIDKKTELSVFEFSKASYEPEYRLYIPVKSAKYFYMIVNDSDMKQDEFEFDKINYQKLIKGLK